MGTGAKILILGGVGVGVYFLVKKTSTSAPVSSPPSTSPDKTFQTLGGMPTGNDLGPLSPILSLPGLAQAYRVLEPVNEKILQPFVADIRREVISPLNSTLGFHAPTTASNPDGTITRDAGNSWYTRHVGRPISNAGSTVVKTITNLF